MRHICPSTHHAYVNVTNSPAGCSQALVETTASINARFVTLAVVFLLHFFYDRPVFKHEWLMNDAKQLHRRCFQAPNTRSS